MDLGEVEKFYQRQARFYDLTRPLFLFNRKKALALLDPRPSDTIYDYACGTGMNIEKLLIRYKIPPQNIIGFDYSEAMLSVARKKYPQVSFIQADVTAYLPEKQAEKIISAYALTLIPDWQKATLQMWAALRPGGRLVLLDFHKWEGPARLLYAPYKAWMRLHKLDLHQPVEKFLKENFPNVQFIKLLSGYNYIAVVEKPL